jgi:hypothetical protein
MVVTVALQPWHVFCTQKALLADVHSLLCKHSTQRPEVAHSGVLPMHAPVAPPSWALAVAPVAPQPTHWFCTQKALSGSVVHSLFCKHSTQRPEVAHIGVAPLHALVMPPSETPPSTVVEVTPAALQPTHWFCTQKALFGSVVHEVLSAHSTQRPEIGSHTEVLPEHTLLVALAHDTQVFWAEQNGRPAALLQ